jgi:hypothetical protein
LVFLKETKIRLVSLQKQKIRARISFCIYAFKIFNFNNLLFLLLKFAILISNASEAKKELLSFQKKRTFLKSLILPLKEKGKLLSFPLK